MKIAAAQTVPHRGDVSANIGEHGQLIELAAGNGVRLIVFPELSLIGYELDLADELAFRDDDPRLDPLRELAAAQRMVLVVGAPVRSPSGLHIGAFIVDPDRSVATYTKRYLHAGEERVFCPGTLNPTIQLENESAAVAICADTNHPLHAERAAESNATLYLASVFFTPKGYARDTRLLRDYAVRHAMVVLLANYGGPSGGLESAGGSAVWSNSGELIATLDGPGAGLVIATQDDADWVGESVRA